MPLIAPWTHLVTAPPPAHRSTSRAASTLGRTQAARASGGPSQAGDVGVGLSAAGKRDPVPLELPVEGVAADAQLGGGTCHVASALLDDPRKRGALGDLEGIGRDIPIGGQGT